MFGFVQNKRGAKQHKSPGNIPELLLFWGKYIFGKSVYVIGGWQIHGSGSNCAAAHLLHSLNNHRSIRRFYGFYTVCKMPAP